MKAKVSPAIVMMIMLLIHSLHGVKWQAMGSGMNNTVISEIWNDIGNKIKTALALDILNESGEAKNNLLIDISTRLNTRWDPAWNVILLRTYFNQDSILYGYAFNNQWMWYNDVPYSDQNLNNIITLIVWKDYNCQDWKNIGDTWSEQSSFSTAQKDAIKAEIDKMTLDKLNNDVWGTAYTMMKNLETNTDFSSGGYSVIMSQYGDGSFLGRVCRVGNGYYYSYKELNAAIFPNVPKGQFYLFQTR